jgi:hypothetical protein
MALNAAEDVDLRVINQLAPYGELPPLMAARLAELRARDRRSEIREPEIVLEWVPTPRGADDSD